MVNKIIDPDEHGDRTFPRLWRSSYCRFIHIRVDESIRRICYLYYPSDVNIVHTRSFGTNPCSDSSSCEFYDCLGCTSWYWFSIFKYGIRITSNIYWIDSTTTYDLLSTTNRGCHRTFHLLLGNDS